MKVQFTNAERTEAILTRGIFRKEFAEVSYAAKTYKSYMWVYVLTGKPVEQSILATIALAAQKHKHRQPNPWTRVNRLAKAKLLPGKSTP